MSLAARVAGPLSQVLARLHRWYATAWLLSRVSLAALDGNSVGRLRYALMMAHRTMPLRTENLLKSLIQHQGSPSAELHLELAAMAIATGLPEPAARQLAWARQKAVDSATLDAADKLLQLSRAEANRSLLPTLQGKLDRLHIETAGLVTLVPVSGKYLELWRLWLPQVRKHACRQIVVMAMDDTAMAELQTVRDVAIVDVREYFSWDSTGRIHPHTRGVLWYLRVLLLRELVLRHHPVLVLDLDAVPIGDVQGMLSAMPSADVVAQIDHSIPKDVDRQLGFVLCCGFMLWRPRSAAALRLLDHFAQEAAIERDDQLALNHLLARQGITKMQEAGAKMVFESAGVRFACPDETLVSRDLTTGSVVRHFHQTGQTNLELRTALGIQ